MNKRPLIGCGLLIAALLTATFLTPTGRYRLLALLNNEPRERGRPLSYWIDTLSDTDATTREEAARALANLGPRAKVGVPALISATADTQTRVRVAAIKALGEIGPGAEDAVAALVEIYRDRSEAASVRSAAIAAFAKLGRKGLEAVPVMVRMMAADVAFARAGQVQMSVSEIGPAAVPVLINLLEDGDEQVRAHAAVALNWIGPRAIDAVPALIRSLQDDSHTVREGAAFALLRIGPAAKDAVPALRKALDDENGDVRRIAGMALKAIERTAPHESQ